MPLTVTRRTRLARGDVQARRAIKPHRRWIVTSLGQLRFPKARRFWLDRTREGHPVVRLVDVKGFLASRGFDYPRLAVLQASEHLYTSVLVQPKAIISVSKRFIGNADAREAEKLFFGAIQISIDKKVELLVTPEYSMPWAVLERALKQTGGPRDGCLWVLGCESLGVTELQNLQARFGKLAIVLHEEIDVNALPSTVSFFNPVVYVFRTKVTDKAESNLVMLLQFKTCVSGDRANIEATNMATGTDVYRFDGGRTEVRLLTLICSDSFAFADKLVDECYKDLLLIHIQLNEKPRDEGYIQYRRRLCRTREDVTEVIALNWSEKIEFRMQGIAQPSVSTNISGSTWHSKAREFEIGDVRVEANHVRGLYYTYDPFLHRHVLHFSYQPAVFVVQSTKVHHHAVAAALSRRTGPEVIEVLGWDSSAGQWTTVTAVDDDFKKFTAGHGTPATELDPLHAGSPLAVERLLAISHGALGPEKDWHRADKLDAAKIDATEVVHRLTVAHDPDGVNFRDERIKRMKALGNLRNLALAFKPAIADLSGGFSFGWVRTHPHCNVVSSDAMAARATLVYAGEQPSLDELSRLYAKTSAVVVGEPTEDRFGVLYRDGISIKFFEPPNAHSVTKIPVARGKDFTDPEK